MVTNDAGGFCPKKCFDVAPQLLCDLRAMFGRDAQ
jgi:hypothetical protein